jgi:hypothetical protein
MISYVYVRFAGRHAGITSISRHGVTAGLLWNFRLDDVRRWHDSELHSLGGPPGHIEQGIQLKESTSRFQYKKADLEAARPPQDD